MRLSRKHVMSDLSASSQPTPDAASAAGRSAPNPWLSVKKAAARLQDWFVIQSVGVKAMVIAMALLIPASGIYSVVLMQKQAVVAEQLKSMTADQAGEAVAAFNPKLPVVFGTGSVLGSGCRSVERITSSTSR
jgi:cell division protease FtsH